MTTEEYVQEMLGHIIENKKITVDVTTMILVIEGYRNRYIELYQEKAEKWDALKKEIRDKLLLSTGQTVEEREYAIIGEITAYKMDIV